MTNAFENCSNYMLAEAIRVVESFDDSYLFTYEDDGYTFDREIPLHYFDPTNFLNGVVTVAAQPKVYTGPWGELPALLVLSTEGVDELPSGYTFTIHCSGDHDQGVSVYLDGDIDIHKPLVTLRGDSLGNEDGFEYRASAHLMLLREDDAETGVDYRWVVLDVPLEKETVAIPRDLVPTQLFPQLDVGYDTNLGEWIIPSLDEVAGRTLLFVNPDGVELMGEYNIQLPKLRQIETEYLNRTGVEYRILNATSSLLYLKMTPTGVPEGPYFVPEGGSIADGPMDRMVLSQYLPNMYLNTAGDDIAFSRMGYEDWSPDFNTIALVLPWLDFNGDTPVEPYILIRVRISMLETSADVGSLYTGVAPLDSSLTDYQEPILLNDDWTELIVTESNRVVFFKTNDSSDKIYMMNAHIQVIRGNYWTPVYNYFTPRDDIHNYLTPVDGTVGLGRGGYGRVIMSEAEDDGSGSFDWVAWSIAGDVFVERY